MCRYVYHGAYNLLKFSDIVSVQEILWENKRFSKYDIGVHKNSVIVLKVIK